MLPGYPKLLILTLLLLSIHVIAQTDTKRLIDYVNPFIGSANDGNTFPGAVVPWGMVSVSPHNSNSPSGYLYGNKNFYGFGHTHLSGTGCADLGSVIVTATIGDVKVNPEEYKTTYSGEDAAPGYYKLYLDELDLNVEVTASARCSILKFTSDTKKEINILIDAGRSLSLIGGGSIRITDNNHIEGSNISGGFCGENNRQTVFFTLEFNHSSSSNGLWIGNNLISENEITAKDTSIGCWSKFTIDANNPLLIKAALSYVSIQNAKENLTKEIADWNFEEVRLKAENLWEENLSRIKVEGNNDSDKTKFYTALYHMLIHPNIINDVNGDYPLMGRNGSGNYKDRNRYSTYSLWDTYRTLHPFLTLVFPEQQSDMIKTMLDMYKENGFLPKWELTGNETYMMVGDPAVPVIADSYIKGIRDFDAQVALGAMLKPVMLKEKEEAPPVRAGYHELLQYKYIPFEQDWTTDWWVWGPVSTTLEYCLSDWTIGRFAEALGSTKIRDEFYNRSTYYRNLFDTTSLFMRPKLKNGKWIEPFDSLAMQGSGDWNWSGGPGYVEGNAWHYTWFVPHDIEGLIKLFGGEDKFSEKLMRAFEEKHFTINNEPDIAYPYLFNYVEGKEHFTKELVHKTLSDRFGTGADGLPGNDDCGTISAWFVFSSLGFYPACPASDYYELGYPLFDKAIVQLSPKYYNRAAIVIERSGSDISFNNNIIRDYRIRHNDMVKGGELRFPEN